MHLSLRSESKIHSDPFYLFILNYEFSCPVDQLIVTQAAKPFTAAVREPINRPKKMLQKQQHINSCARDLCELGGNGSRGA